MILEKLLAIDPLIGMRNAAYVSSCPGKINFPVQISAVAQTGLQFQHFEFALNAHGELVVEREKYTYYCMAH